MSNHLSTGQIAEWIAGERSQENGRHLQQCAVCRAELDGFQSGLAAVGQSLRHWAAQQDAAPMLQIRVQRGPAGVASPWRWAFVAVAMGCLAILPVHWNRQAQREVALQEDAEILNHINTQLSRVVPATMEPLMNLMQDGQEGEGEHK